MSNELCGYVGNVADGYTRRGFIKERAHCYPAVRFEYRPVLPGDRTTIFNGIRDASSGQQEEQIAARAIQKYVVKWNIQKRDGSDVKVHVDEALKLDCHLFQRVFHIVMQNEQTDEDPEWNVVKAKPNRELDAVLGDSPEVESQEADAKNSVTG